MSVESFSPPMKVDNGCAAPVAASSPDGCPAQASAVSAPDFQIPTVEVFGLPLARLTLAQTLQAVDQLIERREPAFFITANLNYAMLCARRDELRELNRRAAFLTADGMPLIWGARFKCVDLPGRVTGADLTPLLFGLAAERGYPVFILGAEVEVAGDAAREMQRRFPALKIAGVESPDLRLLSPTEEEELVERIRQSQARLIVVAFGQPKGELWIARHYRSLGDAVSVQVGAAVDFAAGRVHRAPAWMQRLGLEWLYRVYLEPRRLTWRYANNVSYLCRASATALPGAIGSWWRRAIWTAKGPS